jgi:glyoxylase-like metal-dependent hydrolase (beta-lactamase superfamily II)
MPTIHAIEAGPVATMGYLVANEETAAATVVDAPHASHEWFLTKAADLGCTITHIVLTHSHWDHTADSAPLQRATGAPVIVHERDLYRLADPMKHTLWPLPFTIDAPEFITTIDDASTTIVTTACTFDVLHTPGHTEGGIVLLTPDRRVALVGDTLFAGSVGRTDLPGGDMDTLLHSIRTQLMTLDDDVSVLPGHGPFTTIGAERASNPFILGTW